MPKFASAPSPSLISLHPGSYPLKMGLLKKKYAKTMRMITKTIPPTTFQARAEE